MKCRIKFMLAQVHINQRSDILGSFCSPMLFPTIANHCSLHFYLSPQVGLQMRRKLRSTFFCSEYVTAFISIALHCIVSEITPVSLRHPCSLHGTSFVAGPSPLQSFPPLDGGGLVQVLVRVCFPPPHVTVHTEDALQSV